MLYAVSVSHRKKVLPYVLVKYIRSQWALTPNHRVVIVLFNCADDNRMDQVFVTFSANFSDQMIS